MLRVAGPRRYTGPMPDRTDRLWRWSVLTAHAGQPRYQFTVHSLLTFTAKCGCLLSIMLMSDETALAAVALPVLAVWMPFELVLSRPDVPRVPWAVSGVFFSARMALVYGCCLVALAAAMFGVSLTWPRPWTASQTIGVGFGIPMLLGGAALAALASGIAAAIAWRWDRRARWLVYINGGYLAIFAAVLGVIELLIVFAR